MRKTWNFYISFLTASFSISFSDIYEFLNIVFILKYNIIVWTSFSNIQKQ